MGKGRVVCLLVSLVALRGAAAAADPPPTAFHARWLPGPARAVPRTRSASRDAPLFEYAYGPRAQGSIGGEFGVIQLAWPAVSWHIGMYAMIGLENSSDGVPFPPHQTLFFSLDEGNGKGLLINRRELRLSGGVRYAPF